MHRILGAVILGLALMVGALPAHAATALTVNGLPITDTQIAQRLALFKLERKTGKQAAIDELIQESLQLQEAQRLGFSISEGEVDDAMLQVARNVKVSLSNLETILSNNGVNKQTLRDRLRANLAWGKVVQTAVSARVTVSDAEIEAEAEAQLTAANSFDYILKEIIFLMPNESAASKRTAEANKYRAAFAGCDTAVQGVLNFTDAAVREIGRRHATQMPEAIADELSKLNVGGITKPRVVEGGVSMLAICAKSVAEDTTFLANNLRQQTGDEKLKGEAEKYLAELKAKAQIVYS